MQLLRVQVPHYRVLKQVDIRFEPNLSPQAFPIGSQNGGGKSTLLQLIFGLLYCTTGDRLAYLKNLLQHVELNPDEAITSLATFEILDEGQRVELEFFLNTDAELQKLLVNKAFLKKQLEEKQRLEKNVKTFQRSYENFSADTETNTPIEDTAPSGTLPSYRLSIEQTKKMLDDYQEQLGKIAPRIETLQKFQSKRNEGLSAENIFQLFDLGSIPQIFTRFQTYNFLLNCRSNLPKKDIEPFLNRLAEKVYLIAPTTQIFLFLPPQSRNASFKVGLGSQLEYQQAVETAKESLVNFATYDFFSIDTIINFFKLARDRDFAVSVESDGEETGNHYKTLLQNINTLLQNKTLRPLSDLSGIRFSVEKNGNSLDLSPADLSHGEMKRLILYAWLKSKAVENAIVLLDEAENALHPDWQYRLIPDLLSWEASNQYILATHSYDLCQAVTPAHVKEIGPPLRQPEPMSV